MPKLATRIALSVLSIVLVHCSGGSSGSSPPPTYAVGGQVSGLAGQGLVLHSNLGEDLPIVANGPFAFATKAIGGTAYTVTVAVQPTSPAQTCTVSSGSGAIATGDVTTVAVSCTTSSYTVGGTVTGLAGSGLVLRNGADTESVIADGPFTFAAAVLSGGSFSVSIDAQPSSPAQTCTVSGASGIVGAGNVTSVVVDCATDSFTIGGTISGLAGTLVLANGGEQATINVEEGTFAFATPVLSGEDYAVSVVSSPTSPVWQLCAIEDGTGSGTVGGADVASVVVTCTSYYTLGGSVAGLLQPGLVLQSGDEELELDADGPFTFATRLVTDAEYVVTVAASPATESCSVSNETGTIGAFDVTDVTVTCACSTGLDDCDGDATNGCEIDLRTTVSHCGACDAPCSFPNAGASCSDAACVIGTCDAGFGNCNAEASDGCETDTTTSVSHCGACGNVCTFANAAASCSGGGCVMGACSAPHFRDCVNGSTDGCETDVRDNDAHCGACNNDCTAQGKTCEKVTGNWTCVVP